MKIRTFAADRELAAYLEALVARAYSEMHEAGRGSGSGSARFSPIRWLMRDVPRAWRRHWVAFAVAVGVSLLGAVLGGMVVKGDARDKDLLLPPQFGHLLQNPSERVAEEERRAAGEFSVVEAASFSAMLMNNNIRVTLKAMAYGLLCGVGTLIVLLQNGLLLGVVCTEYAAAGEGTFLAAWLLPHGVPELTAIFLGGQGGFMLGRALLGWGSADGLRARFRAIRGDLITLISFACLLLIWAGLVEAFLSQAHEPMVSYSFKIGFGVAELLLLYGLFLACGRASADSRSGGENDAALPSPAAPQPQP
ncbi:MAG: stage II sporulation protein M [Verrucomicrobiales bacterium]